MSIPRLPIRVSLYAAVFGISIALLPVTASADWKHGAHSHKGKYHHTKYDYWEWQRERYYWREKQERKRKRRLARLARLERERKWRQWERERRWNNRHQNNYGSSRNSAFNSETLGGVIGGILGGVAGTQFGKGSGRVAATIGGTILGAVLGSHVARRMDEKDHQATNNVLERTRTGETRSWKNPDTGTQFSVTPKRTFKSADNRDCRDYSMWVFIDGYEEEVKGTACRTSSGKWVPVKS